MDEKTDISEKKISEKISKTYNQKIEIPKSKIEILVGDAFLKVLGQAIIKKYRQKIMELFFTQFSHIPEYIDFTQSQYGKSHLVSGKVQAGKTHLMGMLALKSILVKKSVLILISPSYSQEQQLVYRLTEIIRVFNEVRKGIQLPELSIPILSAQSTSTNRNIMQALSISRRNRTPSIIIAFTNKSRLEKMCDIIDRVRSNYKREFFRKKRVKYTMIVDEVDENEKRNRAQVVDYFNYLKNKARTFIGVTATSFRNLYSDRSISVSRVYELETHPNYRGIESIIHEPLSDTITAPTKASQNILECDTEIVSYMKSLEGNEFPNHPVHLLYVPSKFVNHHLTIFNLYSIPELSNWVFILYDGTHGIMVKSFSIKSLTINRRTFLPVGEYFKFEKDVVYSQVLSALKNSQEIFGKIKYIITISGIHADRGNSFVDSEYQWHLTHQRLLTTTDQCLTRQMQQCRLFGIYSDNLPLTLNCRENTYRDILKGTKLLSKMANLKVRGHVPICDAAFTKKYDIKLVPKSRLAVGIPKNVIKEKNLSERTAAIPEIPDRVFAISPNSCNSTCLEIYNRIMDYLSTFNGQWKSRGEIVRTIGWENKQTIFARLKDMCHANSRNFESETKQGILLAKKTNSKWEFRLN